ncbi:hypothetical protein ElyMa_005630400 [Elysia marginata]|uniref:Uncharacterized protein n=1 Tax=Elysia marginata TaxID=1093978 RepID=A0AAV4F8V8_9GAST|nr:hypothetical protein ElyMa_005630400 [Elysia marginata]
MCRLMRVSSDRDWEWLCAPAGELFSAVISGWLEWSSICASWVAPRLPAGFESSITHQSTSDSNSIPYPRPSGPYYKALLQSQLLSDSSTSTAPASLFQLQAEL